MNVRFVVEGKVNVEYGWGDAREPVMGERIEPDGSDGQFPAGVYYVKDVAWEVTLRGPRRLVVTLNEAITDPYERGLL
jgi:hypothetical protein